MEQLVQDNQHFLYYLFHLTMGGLYGIAYVTQQSYQFWNILIWFAVLPASWIYLVSNRTSKWVNLLSVPIFLYMFAVHTWTTWFDKAVVLLYKIGSMIHADYKLTSVYVCVFIPLIIYTILFRFFTSQKTFKIYLISLGILTCLVILFFPISNWLAAKYL